jgi:RimJ/RimL family protein N-acetyltransferase
MRLNDPLKDEDCQLMVKVVSDQESGKGGVAKVGISSVEDVRYKHKVHGPRAEFCTLAPPPRGMYFMVFLRHTIEGKDVEGDFVGLISIAFRREMPYPDLGWAVFGPYQGRGYATEAGREALKFWRDVIGVKKLCAMTLDGNVRSDSLAERIGFIRAGTVEIIFGLPPNEEKFVGRGFVLPGGMEWKDGLWIRPQIHRPKEEIEG